jgi:CheY-like chemotaxis protein/HPt (histidine-containing phosphotransfer) domain-containing protein
MHSELRTAAPAPEAVPLPPVQPVPPPPVAPARILIAEDNLVNRTYVERLLRSYGHALTSAADGLDVLELAGPGDFDLILMDCQMPAVDGYDATRELRRREAASGGPRTPIVAMTASATEEIRERCLQAGMDDYLSKPLLDSELQRTLARWLPEQRAPAPAGGPGSGDEEGTGAASAGAADEIASPASADGALDPARLERLRSLFPGDEAFEVLARLLREVESDIGCLDAFLRERQFVEAAAAAHNIRGSAQLVGASRLAHAAGLVEKGGNAEAPSAALLAADSAVLRRVWATTRRALEAVVESDRREYHSSQVAH